MLELAIVKTYHNYTHLFYLKLFMFEIISITYGEKSGLGLQLLNKKVL